jgi:hypothetical protein
MHVETNTIRTCKVKSYFIVAIKSVTTEDLGLKKVGITGIFVL